MNQNDLIELIIISSLGLDDLAERMKTEHCFVVERLDHPLSKSEKLFHLDGRLNPPPKGFDLFPKDSFFKPLLELDDRDGISFCSIYLDNETFTLYFSVEKQKFICGHKKNGQGLNHFLTVANAARDRGFTQNYDELNPPTNDDIIV